MIDLSNRIKEIRSHTGLSQEKFAQKIDLSRSTLALIEVGKSIPGYDTLSNICTAFKILPSYFFDEGDVNLETYISAGKFSEKSAERKGKDKKDIYDSATFKADYGSLVIDNLKKELSTEHSDLYPLYMALSDLPTLIEILNEFFPYVSIENPSNISRYLSKNSLIAKGLDYNTYAPNIINYLKGISKHKEEIILFKEALFNFLKAMKELDNDHSTIPAYIK